MNTPNTSGPRLLRHLALASGLFFSGLLLPLPAFANLIVNGDFETATDTPDWPNGWAAPKSGSCSYEIEDGRRFIRINSTAPGETIILYRNIAIPAGVKAVELSLRARVIGLQPGAQPWFDARVLCDFKSISGVKLKGAKPISFRRDTDGWVERKIRFPVPEGAVSIDIMPSLFQVYTGTIDIDEIQLTEVDPAETSAPAAPAAP
jgi:endoglucanase